MSKNPEISKLEADNAALVAALNAAQDFHASLAALDNSAYKYDYLKCVAEKREIWLAKQAAVEPIIKNWKETIR